MAQGFLKSFDDRLDVHSAGSRPGDRVNPYAVRVMAEAGVDISGGAPESVDRFLDDAIDYVVTVCADAERDCPVFAGKVGKRLHIGFPDPADATGSEDEILAVFRQSRDDIRASFREFYESELLPQLQAA